MRDKTIELWKANSDILELLRLLSKIGWDSIREQSIQRILYLSKVLYSFVHTEGRQIFDDYSFSVTIAGPYSELIPRSLTDLIKDETIAIEDGKIKLIDEDFEPQYDETRENWLKTIVYILGLYGESKIFNFTIRDPVYEYGVKTNIKEALDLSSENLTIKTLESFRKAFEDTLDETDSISKQEYLELYFEYVFSTIIKK